MQIAEILGEGASGLISRAHARNLSRDVAVKVFKGDVTSDGSPLDEMQACILAGSHPHLIDTLGKVVHHPAGKHGLVLELIPPSYEILGRPPTFATCTRDTYPDNLSFPLVLALRILMSVASAARHLHELGISHGGESSALLSPASSDPD